MGLIGNLFNFHMPKDGTVESRYQEAQKAKEDRLKIEDQIEYTNGLLNQASTPETTLRRPLIG